MWYARIENNTVAEAPIQLPDGMTPLDFFPEELANAYVVASSSVKYGWTYIDGKFSAPPPQQPPVLTPEDKSKLDKEIASFVVNQELNIFSVAKALLSMNIITLTPEVAALKATVKSLEDRFGDNLPSIEAPSVQPGAPNIPK